MELGGPCSRLGEGLDEVWIHLLQAAVLLLSCLEAGWPEDFRTLGWALTELCLASADGGHDSWCCEGEDSSNYQLPQFLALWPELKAAVWIMSPECLAGSPGPEKMIETSESSCVSQMHWILSDGGKHRPWQAAFRSPQGFSATD